MAQMIDKAKSSTTNTIKQLAAAGQSVWLDYISREILQNGELKRLINEVGIRGETSNPTIFDKAISGGTFYDDQIHASLQSGKSNQAIFESLAVSDIQNACDLFRPLYDQTKGGDGFVSIEVEPGLARDTEGSLKEAHRLWEAVNRPNLMVKIPGTKEGVPAIQQALEDGVNINITLLFSLHNYEAVARAYITAMEHRLTKGQPVDKIASVASFFVSRVDTLVDKQLDQKIAATSDPAEQQKLRQLKGKAAVANAKLAYQLYEQLFKGDAFARLAAAGAKTQRPLWASTSTKNPEYSDVMYVEDLIGPDTINTMPDKTIDAFLDHGKVERTVDRNMDEARQTMRDLADAGIDFDAVTQQLEDEGIAAFAKSFDDLLQGVDQKRAALAGMR